MVDEVELSIEKTSFDFFNNYDSHLKEQRVSLCCIVVRFFSSFVYFLWVFLFCSCLLFVFWELLFIDLATVGKDLYYHILFPLFKVLFFIEKSFPLVAWNGHCVIKFCWCKTFEIIRNTRISLVHSYDYVSDFNYHTFFSFRFVSSS